MIATMMAIKTTVATAVADKIPAARPMAMPRRVDCASPMDEGEAEAMESTNPDGAALTV